MARLTLRNTALAGVFEIVSHTFEDARGRFARLFCDRELAGILGDRRIVQINHSLTRRKGALRGLHFQYPPHAEAKMVRCLKGRVFDVVVDMRKGSPTFLKWLAVELSREKANALFIPEGCAHGFQTLEEDCELLYLHTAHYAPDHEGGVRWDDPRIGIAWPLPVSEISDRDRGHPLLDAAFEGIDV